MSGRTIQLVVVGAMLAGSLFAETHKDFHFNVGPKSGSLGEQSVRLDLSEAIHRQYCRDQRSSRF